MVMFGFVGIPSVALHKKSWAVIDRPYSLGCATVGALYERPRCIFCAKRSGRAKTRPQETRALIRWRVFVSAQPGRNDLANILASSAARWGATSYTAFAFRCSITILNCPYRNRSPKCAFASAIDSVFLSSKNLAISSTCSFVRNSEISSSRRAMK